MRNLGSSVVQCASDSPQDALFGRIRAVIATTPSSTVDTRTRLFIAVAVASGLSATAVLVACRVVYHRYASGLEIQAASPLHTMIVLLLLAALTSVASLLATWRGRHGFGSGAVALSLTSALVAPLYAALVIVNPVHAHARIPLGVAISPGGLRCLCLSAGVDLLVLAAFTLALRQSVPAGTRIRGAAVGAAAGAWGGLSVFIFCPSDNLQHIFLTHVLPIAAFTLLGVAIVPRAVRL